MCNTILAVGILFRGFDCFLSPLFEGLKKLNTILIKKQSKKRLQKTKSQKHARASSFSVASDSPESPDSGGVVTVSLTSLLSSSAVGDQSTGLANS